MKNRLKKMLVVLKYLLPAFFVLIYDNYSVQQSLEIKNTTKEIITNKEFISDVFVTDQFSDAEKSLIVEAVSEWNLKTKGLVNLTVKFEPFKKMNFAHGIMLIKADTYDPEIMFVDVITDCFCTLGLTVSNHLIPNIKVV